MPVRRRVAGVKQILLMIALVGLGGCGKKEETSQKSEPPKAAPEKLIADPIVEKAIRKNFLVDKPTGELTEVDLTKVASLDLSYTKITDVGLKEVAKMQKLKPLFDVSNRSLRLMVLTRIEGKSSKKTRSVAAFKKAA